MEKQMREEHGRLCTLEQSTSRQEEELKMISGSEAGTLQEMIFSLPEWEMESLMKVCLKHCEVMLPAGWIAVYADGCWGMPEMETETMTCFRLVQETLAWSLEDFFGDGGSAS